jgi:hypothetical protein
MVDNFGSAMALPIASGFRNSIPPVTGAYMRLWPVGEIAR